ncbi:Uncharacterised protein [Mycobacteroides abscessus subsp. abscessus]|nr:Uncharacterised protein [Mycobacteroides abscessus subsp. abscessus]
MADVVLAVRLHMVQQLVGLPVQQLRVESQRLGHIGLPPDLVTAITLFASEPNTAPIVAR